MTGIHRAMAIVAATLGIAAAFNDAGTRYISAPALAELIMRADPALRLFDLRPRADYNDLHIPTAMPATLEELQRTRFSGNETVVLYQLRSFDADAHAAGHGRPLRSSGVRHVLLLREGLYEWIARVREPRLAADATPAERSDFERAALFSRFFGGMARASVPRSEVPTGYWTSGIEAPGGTLAITESNVREALLRVRRRGC